MKETGILFKPDMIRANLEGRKSQTRRIIKPQPDDSGLHDHTRYPMAFDDELQGWWGTGDETGESKQFKCRYGKPGDLLYVKGAYLEGNKMEDGAFELGEDGEYIPRVWYKASSPNLEWVQYPSDRPSSEKVPWKSPLFMPKRLARIWLRLKDVRVEQLRDISQEDAKAEGVLQMPHRPDGIGNCKRHSDGSVIRDCYVCAFRVLWNKINGSKGFGWDSNPFVWVLQYEVLSTTGRPKI